VTRTIRRFAALLAIAAVVASGCSGSSHSKPQAVPHTGGTLRLAVVGLDSLDPGTLVPTNQADMVAVNLLARGLTSIDPVHNQVVPALATKWSSNARPAPTTTAKPGTTGTSAPAAPAAPALVGTKWTFTLDPKARFSDGSAVTPSAVIASLTAVAKGGSTTLAGARLDVVQGYAQLVAGKAKSLSGLRAGDDTVEITTTAPDAELPMLLGSPVYAVVKPTATSGSSGGSPSSSAPSTTAASSPAGASTTTVKAAKLTAPIGSGPFVVKSDDGTTLKLVRSPDSVAELNEVDLIRTATTAEALAAVRGGAADWAAAPPADKASIVGGDIATTVSAPLGAEEFLGMNLASPTFANVSLRKAIAKAIDPKTVVAKALPGLDVSAGVVPKGVPGAVADPCGVNCAYDPAASKALLAQGYPNGGIPQVEIDTDNDPTDVALVNAVAFQLATVGIPAIVKTFGFAEYQTFITSGKQQLFRTGWVGLSPSAGAYLGPLFRSNSLDNSTAFKSAAVDTGLAAAQGTASESRRLAAYQALQTQIMGDVPVVPLASFTQVVALTERVQHYAARLDGTFDANRVEVQGAAG
jgi:peptide/nickel transport system substrate-binding protein